VCWNGNEKIELSLTNIQIKIAWITAIMGVIGAVITALIGPIVVEKVLHPETSQSSLYKEKIYVSWVAKETRIDSALLLNFGAALERTGRSPEDFDEGYKTSAKFLKEVKDHIDALKSLAAPNSQENKLYSKLEKAFAEGQFDDVFTLMTSLSNLYTENQQTYESASIQADLGKLKIAFLDFDNAARHFDAAVRWAETATGKTHEFSDADRQLKLVEFLSLEGLALNKSGHFGKAEHHYMRALQEVRNLSNTFEADIDKITQNTLTLKFIEISRDLADAYRKQGLYDQGEKLLNEAIEKLDKAANESQGASGGIQDNQRERVKLLKALGRLYRDWGDYPTAEKTLREGLKILSDLNGKGSLLYAQALMELGLLYSDQGQFERSRTLFGQAFHIQQELVRTQQIPPNHPDIARSFNQLGRMDWRLGDLYQAQFFLAEGLKIRENTIGKNHPDYASSLDALARVLLDVGKIKEAEKHFQQALKIREKIYGETYYLTVVSFAHLGDFYRRQRQYDKAEPLLVEANERADRLEGKQLLWIAQAKHSLAMFYLETGKLEEAEPLFQTALINRKQIMQPNHPDLIETEKYRDVLLKELGR
jgi:tetratricopeptide (TPR) repeat protein